MITIILLIIAFMAYSVMWTLQFHFYQSIFRNLNKFYWNPIYSWQNKYKPDLKTPKFFGSTSFLVSLTDAFHLFQEVFLNSIFLCIAVTVNWYSWYINWLIIRIVYGIVFNLMFNKILIKK